MDFEVVKKQALDFRQELLTRKEQLQVDFSWYPYDTMANIFHLDAMLTGERRNLFEQVAGGTVADIGAADGDFAFFLEQRLGCSVDLIDNAPTNFNGVRGAHRMREELGSNVQIHEVDLDTQFRLPRDHYDLVFFLGILYHLKNPYYVLEELAKRVDRLVVSTRIAQLSPDHETKFAHLPVAYLLHPTEANNDSTNFWIFSEAGLRRIFDRTGWAIEDYVSVGATEGSDPAHADRDERAFALLRSTRR
ncbi:class I SAM-dependent methyltransferase [Lentzea aerocolonigenes]|uniref:class I SAM-dependent methyltransferase n=1 Tax=Lentzea aerocolonigenes TaxID=68170 RepID=UPI0004C36A7F|nr:class I SAM-dependent methyltransferase [Lentzea aerocolonigenes]